LLLKASFEVAHGFGMEPGFLSALGDSTIAKDDDRTDDFIAMLRGVVKGELWVVRIQKGQHR
jgi:hypothetical protein